MYQKIQRIVAPVLVPGQVVKGMVTAAHFAGVTMTASVGGCIVHGTISPRCYGTGRARMVALDADWRANGNASYVGSCRKSETERKYGESDLAILQTLAALPQSIVCSRDGFADYGSAFPEVVANRVRQFFVVSLPNGCAVLTVEGAGCGAVIVPTLKGDDLKTK